MRIDTQLSKDPNHQRGLIFAIPQPTLPDYLGIVGNNRTNSKLKSGITNTVLNDCEHLADNRIRIHPLCVERFNKLIVVLPRHHFLNLRVVIVRDGAPRVLC